MNGLFRVVAILALAGAPFVASAASPGDGRESTPAAVSGAPMAAAERSDAAKTFVAKWGEHVKRVYRIDPVVWASRMSSVFAAVDATNFRKALARDTFEGGMAEINGAGNRLTDKQAMQLLSKTRQTGGAAAPPNTLGALSNDLVYTPIAPCRIVDTRNTSAGRLAANSTRDFFAVNLSSFASQGGSSTNCGTSGLSASAVAVNVTAVTPNYRGYTTVYPFGMTRPLAASVNYGPGAIVNNALIVQIPNPLANSDFTIYSFAPADYVVDIVGYFAPPVATAPQCVDVESAPVFLPPGAIGSNDAVACPAGYTDITMICETNDPDMTIISFNDGYCVVRNGAATNEGLAARRKCCRVPGR